MKQWTTEIQFNELTEDQKGVWHQWVRNHHYTFDEVYTRISRMPDPEWQTLNFPSIGEMIEFLHERCAINITDADEWNVFLQDKFTLVDEDNKELCDALWEAVKKVF